MNLESEFHETWSMQFILQCNFNCFAVLVSSCSSSNSSTDLKVLAFPSKNEHKKKVERKLCYETFVIDQTETMLIVRKTSMLFKKVFFFIQEI